MGKGILFRKKCAEVVIGWFYNGAFHGKCRFHIGLHDTYEGDMVDNKITGRGKYIWQNDQEYDGEWLNDEQSGYGVYKSLKGKLYEGNFLKSKRHGRGKVTYSNGMTIEGTWKQGLKDGLLYKIKGNELFE